MKILVFDNYDSFFPRRVSGENESYINAYQDSPDTVNLLDTTASPLRETRLGIGRALTIDN